MGKKILSVLIAVCLLSTMIPVSAAVGEDPAIAEGEDSLSGNGEEGVPDVQTLEGTDGGQILDDGDADGGDGSSVNPPMPEINEEIEGEGDLNACEVVEANEGSVDLRAGQMASLPTAAVFDEFSVAITNDGDLYCWGYNGYGQVGNGNTENQSKPVKVLSNVISVSSYLYGFMAAITNNGDLYCWGNNGVGQVGNGNTENQSKPVKVLNDVASVSFYGPSSTFSVAAITSNGDLYCWGYNEYGQVGNGSTTNQSRPVKVLSNISSVSGYKYGSAAVTNDGDLYSWGSNGYGQVGNGSTESQTKPVKVLDNVTSVFTYGCRSMAAITDNRDLYCWGYNYYGQVGDGSTTNQSKPIKVLSDVVSVSGYGCVSAWGNGSGYGSMAAITGNGDLYCWGYNGYGQVGNDSMESQNKPIKVLSNATSVSVYGSGYGRIFMAAITRDRDLYCWGYNESGQIGNGSKEDQAKPVKVLDNVISVSGAVSVHDYVHSIDGDGFTTAITSNGDLYCWGDNKSGQVGNGSTTDQTKPVRILSNVTSVSISGSGSCSASAITNDRDLYCWGRNVYGQIGNGTTGIQTIPVKVLDLKTGQIPSRSDPTEEEKLFIKEHKDFVNSAAYEERMESCWSEVISTGLDTAPAKVAENIYNVLNSGSELISCKALSIFDNPYDVILQDLILSQTETTLDKYEMQVDNKLGMYVSMLQDFCKMNSDKWTLDTDYTTSVEKLAKIIKDPGSFDTEDPFYKLCLECFGDFYDSGKIQDFLNTYGKASDFISAFNKYANVIEWVSDCMNYNALVSAYLDTSDEFKASLVAASVFMEQNALDVNKEFSLSRAAYAVHFSNAVDKYTSFLTEEKVADLLFKTYFTDGIKRVGDVFGDTIAKSAISYFSEGLGLSETAASWIFACVTAYKYGWKISDAITKNGTNMDCREYARACHFFEEALAEVVDASGSVLKKEGDIQSAKNFDAAYTALQNLEYCSLKNYIKYLKNQQKAFVQGIAHGFNNKFNASEIEDVNFLLAEWENICCHFVKSSNPENASISSVKIGCPTDVFVYDSASNLVLTIENNEVTMESRGLAASVVGETKILAIPDISKYRIDIRATDDGVMHYSVDTYQADSLELIQAVNYSDVGLTKGNLYTGINTGVGTGGISKLLYGENELSPSGTLESIDEKVFVSGVSINGDTSDLSVGDTVVLSSDVLPENAYCKNVSWTSSDKEVATINEEGKMTAVGEGKADITCAAIDGSGIFDTRSITVKEQDAEDAVISLNRTTLSLTVGSSETLTATVTPAGSSDHNILWSSSDPSVATVTDTGLVKAVSAGTVEITAETADGRLRASCTVTVSVKPNSNGGGNSSQTPGTGGSGGFMGTGTPAATSTPTPVPSGTPAVTVTPAPDGNGTPTVTVTPTPTTIPKPSTTITATPAPQPKASQSLRLKYDSKNKKLKKKVGAKLTQRVTGAKTKVTFVSSDPNVARVNKNSGAITCTGVGKAVITAMASESQQYRAASKKTTIYVIPKTAKVRSIKSNKKGQVTVKGRNKAKDNTGYQIQYKHNGKTKKILVKGRRSITKTFKNLRSGKTFKVRMRAYKKVKGRTYYGRYGKWKTLKKVR